MYFYENGYKVSDYIKDYDKEKLMTILHNDPRFTDEKLFDTDLLTMLTQAYKRIIKDNKNKKS